MNKPTSVTICEVGPRDGLQNEKSVIAPEAKIEFVNRLGDAGLRFIEVTSFVRPGVIPQLADASRVYPAVRKDPGRVYIALVPNAKGFANALDVGLREAALFTAASESFTKKNINCTIAESLDRFAEVARLAHDAGVSLRGYVSTVVECPYEGAVAPAKVAEVCARLLDFGVREISLGETIGVAVPDDVSRLLDAVLRVVPVEKLAGHFHDTRGTALANVFRALEFGLTVFDASAGGLGGCPYAPGAAGNLATEDLVYALERSGIRTGVDLDKLVAASAFIEERLGRRVASRVYLAASGTTNAARVAGA